MLSFAAHSHTFPGIVHWVICFFITFKWIVYTAYALVLYVCFGTFRFRKAMYGIQDVGVLFILMTAIGRIATYFDE